MRPSPRGAARVVIGRRSQAASLDGGDHGLALSRRDPLDPPVCTRRRHRLDVVALRPPVVAPPPASQSSRRPLPPTAIVYGRSPAAARRACTSSGDMSSHGPPWVSLYRHE